MGNWFPVHKRRAAYADTKEEPQRDSNHEHEDTHGALPGDLPKKYQRMSRRFSVSAESDTTTEEVDLKIVPKTQEARERMLKSVAHCFLFSGLDPEQLDMIVNSMKEKEVEAGEVVIKQGEDLGV